MVGLIGPNLEFDGEIGLLCSGKARYAELMPQSCNSWYVTVVEMVCGCVEVRESSVSLSLYDDWLSM